MSFIRYKKIGNKEYAYGGGIIEVKQIDDEKYYQEFFRKQIREFLSKKKNCNEIRR